MTDIRVTQMNLVHLDGGHSIIISGADGSGYCLRRFQGEQTPQGCGYPKITLYAQDIADLAAGHSINAIPVAVDNSAQDRVTVRLFTDVAEFRQSIYDSAERRGMVLPAESRITDEEIAEWIRPVADLYGPTS